MTRQLRTIGAVSCAKVGAFIYGILGLLIGVVISLFTVLGVFGGALAGAPDGAFGPGGGPGAIIGLLFGIGAIVLFPLIYAAMGAIGGLIMAAIYNLVAKTVGGIELEID